MYFKSKTSEKLVQKESKNWKKEIKTNSLLEKRNTIDL